MQLLKALVTSILLAGLLPGAALAAARTAAAAPAYSAEAQTALATLNAYRKSKGLGAVQLQPALTQMAQALVDACMKAGRCDHNTGGSFQQRAAKYGFSNIYGAENLMIGGTTLDQAFAWWKASSVHNANMLIKQVVWLGFARGPTKGAAYWVLIVTSNPM